MTRRLSAGQLRARAQHHKLVAVLLPDGTSRPPTRRERAGEPRWWWQTPRTRRAGEGTFRGWQRGPWAMSYDVSLPTAAAGVKLELSSDSGLNLSGGRTGHRGLHLGWMPMTRWPWVRGGFELRFEIGDPR